jgi:hypothetical protein
VSPDERPLAGAPLRVFGGGRIVEVVSGADGSYEAATVKDVKGSWALCSADAVRAGTVEARKEGYAPASISAVYGWALDYVDLELVLTRQ